MGEALPMLLPSEVGILAGWPIQAVFWLEWVKLLLRFVPRTAAQWSGVERSAVFFSRVPTKTLKPSS